MANVYVTIEYGNHQKRDLAVPLEVPCRVLSIALARALQQESGLEESFTLMELLDDGTRRIQGNASLGDAEVYNGSTLRLMSEQRLEARPIPQGGAYLETAEGKRLSLNGAYTLIGRRDLKHNILPDIDLAERDEKKISSRRHSCIEFDKKVWVVTDLGSSNGTWVNGERLTANVPHALQDGDEIAFGRKGVKVMFRRG